VISKEPSAVPTPAERVDELLGGFQATQALHAAAKLGVFDVLRDESKTSDEIAVAVGAHEPSLRRLLRFLGTIGALVEDGYGRFAATPMGELLRSDHPASARPWAILYGSPAIWRTYGELYESVLSGQPAFERVHGAPFFEYLERNQEDASVFNAAMTSGGSPSAILDAYDFSSFAKIVDVGGGQGALLQAILEQYPHATGVLYDLPSVIAQASAITDVTVAARRQVVAGDMFQSIPTGCDAYLLKRIIHDWSDAEAIQILRNCRQAMSDQGRILLIEQIIQPSHQSSATTSADLNMLVLVSGRERTEKEFRDLLASAGLELTRVIPAGGRSVIEAVPA